MTRARIFSQALANIIAGGGGGSANITFASLQPFLTTANVIELTNLYFSNARVFANLQLASINDFYDVVTTNTANGQTLVWNGYEWTSSNVSSVANLSLSTTNDLNEGSSNLYYTNARARTAFTAGNPTIIIDWNAGTIIANVESIAAASGTTDTVPEGFTNKYFTNARVYSNVELMSINVLADVNISGAENGQVLTYDSSTSTWISANASSAASAQSSENANIANLVLSINNFTTANLTESASNLYFTAARVNAVIQPFLTAANIADFASTVNATIFPFLTTSNVVNFADTVNATVRPILTTANVVESSSNLYFTYARANAAIWPSLTAANIANFNSTTNTVVRPILTTANVTESSSNLYFTYARANEAIWPSLTTSNVIEGTNQYFTNARIFTGLLTDNANVKDITVNGNLLVYGNLALLNVGNVQISSRTITIAKDAQNVTQAEGSGILINGANAKITYGETGDYIGINKNITVYGNVLPAVSGIFNLGSPNKKFLSLYLGTQTIFLGNVSLGESPSGGLSATGPNGDPTDGSFANLTAVQSITVDRVYGNVFPLTEFNSYIGGNATQFVSNVTGNLYFGIRKDSDWNKFAGIRIAETRDNTGNVRSDVIVYNDSENTNNSTARVSILGSGNVEIDADVVIRGNLNVRDVVTNGIVSATKFYGNVQSNTILTNSISSNVAILGNVVIGTASFDNVVSKVATFDSVVVHTNLFVYGDVTTYGANNLSVSDNMFYLNNGSVTNNPDIGFAFNYNDGVYKHGGFFRDATDGTFKVFDNYTLEPDANIFINTDDASFRLGNLQATNYLGNVTGFVTGQVSSLGNHTTDSLTEGSRLYFTNVRVLQAVNPLLTTANISELNNQYFTNVRVLQVVDPLLTTSNVIEGTNLYFTNARVLSNVEQMSINVFADVDITGIENNGILIWNGTKFVSGSVSAASSSNVALFAYLANFANTAGEANTVVTLSNFTTSDLKEGSNLYFTYERANAVVWPSLTAANIANFVSTVNSTVQPFLTTANVIESSSNLYFTAARVNTVVQPFLTTANVVETPSNLYFTNARAITAVTPLLTTANVIESASNLYFSNARVLVGITTGTVQGNIIVTELVSANSIVANNVNALNGTFTNSLTIGSGAGGSITGIGTISSVNANVSGNLNVGTISANIILLNGTNILSLINATSSLTTANVIESASNLYFTAARVNATVQPFLTTANVGETSGNLYFTNARVISALVNSNVSVFDLYVAGNLVVQGDTTTLNVATLDVEDKNITIGKGLLNAISADGAGITIEGAQATFLYKEAGDKFALNKSLDIDGNIRANSWTGLYTSNVIENTNLFFTNARAVSAVTPLLTTANVIEDTNLYFTNTRAVTAVTPLLTTANVIETSGNLYFTDARVVATVQPLLTTANVIETSSNLYFTNARVLSSLYDACVTVRSLTAKETITANSLVINGAQIFSAGRGANITVDTITANIVYSNSFVGTGIGIPTLSTSTNLIIRTGLLDVNANLQVQGKLLASELIINGSNVFELISNQLTTADVREVSSNLYYTDARVLANVEQMSINVFADVDITGIENTGILIWNGTKFISGSVSVASSSNIALFAYVAGVANVALISDFANVAGIANVALLANIANTVLTLNNFTTADLKESSNLYFTNTRVLASLASANVIVNNLEVLNAISYANVTQVVKVYQYYNEATQSLDTVFL